MPKLKPDTLAPDIIDGVERVAKVAADKNDKQRVDAFAQRLRSKVMIWRVLLRKRPRVPLTRWPDSRLVGRIDPFTGFNQSLVGSSELTSDKAVSAGQGQIGCLRGW